MKELNLAERNCSPCTVGEIMARAKEQLCAQEIHQQPITQLLTPSIAEALGGGSQSVTKSLTPSIAEALGGVKKSTTQSFTPSIAEALGGNQSVTQSVTESETTASGGGNHSVTESEGGGTPPSEGVSVEELKELGKALKRGAYTSTFGEVSATKLLETAQSQMDTLVEPLLPRVGVVALVGSSDCGKSSLLRGLALAVSAGAPEWLGMPLKTNHQRALYISTEDDESAIATLLDKQNQELRLSRGDLAGLDYIFDTENLYSRLDKLLKEKHYDLIIVDAFSDLFRGAMNENNKVRGWLQEWHEMALQSECLVIFLHHTGKRTEALLPSKHNSIGSQGFEAKMRLMMELRTDSNNPRLRHLCVVKGNYLGPEWKGHSFVLEFSEWLNFSNTGERVAFEHLRQLEVSDELPRPSRRERDEERYEVIMDMVAEGRNYEEIAEAVGYAHRSSVSKFLKRQTTPHPQVLPL